MDDLGRIQKLKKFMESHGCDFPEEANYGKRMNRKSKFTPAYILIIPLPSDNVRRARAAHCDAQDALKVGNLDEAVEAADEMMFLLALHRIINPLVEIDMAGRLVSLQIKVTRL